MSGRRSVWMSMRGRGGGPPGPSVGPHGPGAGTRGTPSAHIAGSGRVALHSAPRGALT